jgi:predicted PurR-regulated permease PerM
MVGGLISFGFLGLFVGPVVLAIGHAAWREWLKG